MSNKYADDRVAYGGHWWRKDEEDFILVYDEKTDRWDLWGAEPGDPLPPPQFLPEGASVTNRVDQWRFYGVSKVLLWAFALAATIHIAISVWIAVGDPASTLEGKTYDLLIEIYYLTQALWQITLGGLVAFLVLNLNRYIESRRLEPD